MGESSNVELQAMTRKVTAWVEQGVSFEHARVEDLLKSVNSLMELCGTGSADDGADLIVEEATANRSG